MDLWQKPPHDNNQYELVSQNAFKLYEKLTDWEGWKVTLMEILKNKV